MEHRWYMKAHITQKVRHGQGAGSATVAATAAVQTNRLKQFYSNSCHRGACWVLSPAPGPSPGTRIRAVTFFESVCMRLRKGMHDQVCAEGQPVPQQREAVLAQASIQKHKKQNQNPKQTGEETGAELRCGRSCSCVVESDIWHDLHAKCHAHVSQTDCETYTENQRVGLGSGERASSKWTRDPP